ncbi:MAG TPA: hypothetical protein VK365_01040 [Nocardioidaceae bacterium]|jgi:hypothetical protein|nr:hypothetical protein [Nocardioidaceae bacterium]
MEWFLLAALTTGGGGYLARRWRANVARRREQQTELEGVRHLAEEDVTLLGEQLQRLDREVEGRALDEAARLDYQKALDSYESAQRAIPRIRGADEISTITDTLSTGRYALSCVQARLADLPVPERRVPCFFNPQHGPSVTDVRWNQPAARGTRIVPACAQDAARVANRERVEVRTVTIGSRRVPYWEAGAAYLPYGQGYFPGASVVAWAFLAPSASDASSGWHGGGDYGGGFDGGFGAGIEGGGGGD